MAIYSVIRCDLNNDILVSKHECEDFNNKSQLIVQQSQEAIFFYNGQPQDVFGPGSYTLDTANLPLLSRIINRASDGVSPFHATVYFFNKVSMPDVKWGTAASVSETYEDSTVNLNIGARGGMTLHIENSRMLIEKMVGTETKLSKDKFIDKLLDYIIPVIKDSLNTAKNELDLSIFKMPQNLTAISKYLSPEVSKQLEIYGIELENFSVSGMQLPENDPIFQKLRDFSTTGIIDKADDREFMRKQKRRMAEEDIKDLEADRELMREQKKRMAEANLEAFKRQVGGYTYQEERQLDIAHTAAGNSASGEFTNMGIGLGMMAGVGTSIGSQTAAAVNSAMGAVQPPNPAFMGTPAVPENPAPANNMIFCPSCGNKIPRGKFCMECGYKFEIPDDICKNCGKKLLPGAKFCMECGTPV